jgi:hypothetical protein
MNLLMLILIFLALCVAGGIAYFAWTLVPKATEDREPDEHADS